MLCQLAHRFPPFVETFMERSRRLRRRFREETITDLLMYSLIVAGERRVIVEFPDEPITGADMEWNFINEHDESFFRIVLQAKQSFGNGGVWTRHCYRELLHSSGKGPKLQAVALCDTARSNEATYPLYIFYTSKNTCESARSAGLESVSGVSLADGYSIEVLATNATTQQLRTRNKCLKTIAPLLFSLRSLFCPPSILEAGPYAFAQEFAFPIVVARRAGQSVIGIPIPPTPKEIRQRIVDVRAAMVQAHHELTALPDVPAVSHRIPDDLLPMLEPSARARAPAAKGLKLWRVTFVSAGPRDFDDELGLLERR